MKKIVLLVTILLVCISLISCGDALRLLSYSISGNIMDPLGDFSRGIKKGTLVFGGKNYILIDELNGEFDFRITEEDILLGSTSNYPLFPSFGYYANTLENADYIAGGSLSNSTATFVYLREDLYSDSLHYVLRGTGYEFDFSSAFIKTEEVSYKKHIEGKDTHGVRIYFYMKDYPRLTATIRICKINEKWYYVDPNAAFAASEDFLSVLEENNLLR